MRFSELRKMAYCWWEESFNGDMSDLAQARVITGNGRNDLFFHRMMVEHGVEFVLVEELSEGRRQWQIEDYRVVDEQKFAWFVLRWS